MELGAGKLSPTKAVWHPQRDDIFIVGSMEQPRRVIKLNNFKNNEFENIIFYHIKIYDFKFKKYKYY